MVDYLGLDGVPGAEDAIRSCELMVSCRVRERILRGWHEGSLSDNSTMYEIRDVVIKARGRGVIRGYRIGSDRRCCSRCLLRWTRSDLDRLEG